MGFKHPLNDVRGAERNRRHLAEARRAEEGPDWKDRRRRRRAREQKAAREAAAR